MIRILILALPLTLYAQTVTFSPYDSISGRTIWSVNACLPANSPAVTLSGGSLYQILAVRGVNPLPLSSAMAVLQSRSAMSVGARLVKYSGWLAVAGGVLLNTETVQASKDWRVGINLGGAFLAVLVPLARREIPAQSDIVGSLLGPFLSVPAGGCSSAVVLGGPSTAFQVTM